MADFKVPDLGEGVTEAEVDRWLVKEGDVVAEDDPIVELITDKATAEIPSPFAGVVRRIHVPEGQVVPVGTILISIDSDRDPVGDVAASPEPAVPVASAPPRTASGNGEVKALPPIRKLARELGVDLRSLTGSGPEGRILREDVEAAAATRLTGAVRTSAPAAKDGRAGGRREPLRGVRRKIAERMQHAHLTVPPVTHVEECDVTELDATRKLANERDPGATKLTFLPFIVKAVVSSLRTYPALNASLDEEAGEIVFHDHYDIGVAVDTPAGLTVPVIRDADTKRLREIAAEVDRLAEAARQQRLSAEDLRGGTFTVTSPGRFGGLMATPIVFHPQSAILGVHRAIDRPVVRDGLVVIRKMMNLSITFDHRILDGMTAAQFLMDVVELLEHPAVLALEG